MIYIIFVQTINKFQVLLVHYSKWQDATTHFAAGVEVKKWAYYIMLYSVAIKILAITIEINII